MYSVSLSLFISVSLCVFPDPSLTPENLSSVLDMVDWLWSLFSRYVNIPESEIDKIGKQSSSHWECKLAVSLHLISTHPSLSWTLVAHALYRMVPHYGYDSLYGDVVSCHRALDHLQQKFPTGNTYCIQHKYGPTPREGFPRGGGGLLTTNVLPPPA